MTPMRSTGRLLLLAALVRPPTSLADTVVLRRRSGEEVVVARNVVVDSVNLFAHGAKDTLDLYHHAWDAKAGILVREFVSCDASRGETLRVDRGSDSDHHALVARIRRMGTRARITRRDGRAVDVFCVHAHYGAPKGRLMGSGGRADDSVLLLRTASGGTREVPFAKIASISFTGGTALKLTMRDERVVEEHWRGPGLGGMEQTVFLEGVGTEGSWVSEELADIASVTFASGAE